MKTELLFIPDKTNKTEIEKAAEILKNGGLVAIPTETVYGLGASALSEKAIKNIYKAKGRPSDNPLIVHIAEKKVLKDIAKNITNEAKVCMSAFWPGPFTAVLPKKDIIPSAVSGGLDTVAVRMPSNEVAREIIKKSGLPIAAPSANSSGLPSPTSANHVIDDLNKKIDAIVVSNDCEIGVESTVVTFAENPPRLLRPGGITVEQIKKFVPNLVIDSAVTNELKKGQTVASPGMKYKHYSPKAEVVMIKGESPEFTDYCNKHYKDIDLVICFEEEKSHLKNKAIVLGKAKDYKTQAENLFKTLRYLDEQGIKKVFAHAPKTEDVGLAVYNRLIRACGFKVIEL